MAHVSETFKGIVPILVVALVLVTLPGYAEARATNTETRLIEVKIPVGTKVYCEMGQYVESKKPFQVGDRVKVHAWRDVVVDGHVVIPAGSPVDAHISMLKTNKIAGVKGKLEISANSIMAIDGKSIPLTGGYGKQGRSNTALAVTLAVLVLVPLIFIHGKKAKLEPGALFDAYIDQPVPVMVEVPVTRGSARKASPPARRLDLSSLVAPELDVEVLYDELEAQEKPKALPVHVTVCGVSSFPELRIDTINGAQARKVLEVVPGEVEESEDDGEICWETHATVRLKPLLKQFRQGINRFHVAYDRDGERIATEIVLDVQL